MLQGNAKVGDDVPVYQGTEVFGPEKNMNMDHG